MKVNRKKSFQIFGAAKVSVFRQTAKYLKGFFAIYFHFIIIPV